MWDLKIFFATTFSKSILVQSLNPADSKICILSVTMCILMQIQIHIENIFYD